MEQLREIFVIKCNDNFHLHETLLHFFFQKYLMFIKDKRIFAITKSFETNFYQGLAKIYQRNQKYRISKEKFQIHQSSLCQT